MKQKKVSQHNSREPDTLVFHREMYQRRLRKLQERGGLTEKEIADQANNPAQFKRDAEPADAGTQTDGKGHSRLRK
jgi:hypothetical protein